MIKILKILLRINILVLIIVSNSSISIANNAGSRASYSRTGYAGAKHVAMGSSVEAFIDDVFAIYWNPAGLINISENKINEEKNENNFSEEELINFSDENNNTFQTAISAAKLDIEREVFFAGAAFNLFDGVMGLGLYSVVSDNIETRDENGNLTGDALYTGSITYFSYSYRIMQIITFGCSFKTLYEKIDTVDYYGFGSDFGTQIDVFPLVKVGFVIKDLGTGLKPFNDNDNIENKYDFSSPVICFNLAVSNLSNNLMVSLGIIKKIEQDNIDYKIGARYNFFENASFLIGFNDKYFTTGLALKIKNYDISYAFSYDNIKLGYNNTISVLFVF